MTNRPTDRQTDRPTDRRGRSVKGAEHPRAAGAAPVLRYTLTLTLNDGNRYDIMVTVPGERKLELTVVRNYSVPQLQPANLPRAGPKAPSK